MKPANPLTPIGVWLVRFLINASILALVFQAIAVSSVGGGIVVRVATWAAFAAKLSSWPAAFAKWP